MSRAASPALIPQARAMRVSGSDYWGVFLSLEIVDELEAARPPERRHQRFRRAC